VERGAWIVTRRLPDAIPSDVLPYSAASRAVQIVLTSLWRPIWFAAAVGVVVAAVAFLAGSSSAAVKMRERVNSIYAMGRERMAQRGWSLGSAGAWMERLARPITIAILVVAALVLVFWSSPTWLVVAWTAAISGLLVAVVAFLGTPEPSVAEEAPVATMSARRGGHRLAA
jgi:hypothetical protein